jgi:Mn2+/Fe2+ NRAMP family transporter
MGTYSQAGAQFGFGIGWTMLLVQRRKVMGDLVIRGWLYWLGWSSTFAMALCTVGMTTSLGR